MTISGALVVEHSVVSCTIGLSGGAGTFNLIATEIAVIKASGATSITIGKSSGTGALTLGGGVDLASKTVTIYSARINDATNDISADSLTPNLASTTGPNTVKTTVTTLTADTNLFLSDKDITVIETDGLALGAIDVSSGTFDLTAAGAITQSGIMTAGTLVLTNTTSATTLDQNNLVTNLGAIDSTGGDFSLTNTTALLFNGTFNATGHNITVDNGDNALTFTANATTVVDLALTASTLTNLNLATLTIRAPW